MLLVCNGYTAVRADLGCLVSDGISRNQQSEGRGSLLVVVRSAIVIERQSQCLQTL